MAIIRDTKDLGEFIRRIRKARGYTQAQLAEIAGVGVVYISQLENGKETAEIGKALNILQLLSVDLEATDRRSGLPASNRSDDLIPIENLYLAIPTYIDDDGREHAASVDQAYWHPIQTDQARADA